MRDTWCSVPYFSRSTNVMFSAISATRFAMRDAMIVYGDACCWAPLAAPLVAFCVFFAAVLAGFREAVVLLVVRLTGAEATEAGMVVVMVNVEIWQWRQYTVNPSRSHALTFSWNTYS